MMANSLFAETADVVSGEKKGEQEGLQTNALTIQPYKESTAW